MPGYENAMCICIKECTFQVKLSSCHVSNYKSYQTVLTQNKIPLNSRNFNLCYAFMETII